MSLPSGQTQIKLNTVSSEPTLRDALDMLKTEIFQDLNCHHVGQIESFDPIRQIATVSINYVRTYFEPDEAGVVGPVDQEYPLLIDVPVIILGGAGAALTMPIAAGDDCLVLFNDRDIDVWFTGNYDLPCATARAHHIADGFALVGVRNTIEPVINYDSARAVLRNGLSSRIGVAAGAVSMECGLGSSPTVAVQAIGGTTNKVLIANGANLANTLNAVLQPLFTQLGNLQTQISAIVTGIAGLTVVCTAPGNPSTTSPSTTTLFGPAIPDGTGTIPTALTPIATAIAAVGSSLGGLLE